MNVMSNGAPPKLLAPTSREPTTAGTSQRFAPSVNPTSVRSSRHHRTPA